MTWVFVKRDIEIQREIYVKSQKHTGKTAYKDEGSDWNYAAQNQRTPEATGNQKWQGKSLASCIQREYGPIDTY